MDFKNFRFGLIVRTIFLGITLFFAIFSSYQNEWYVTTFISGLLAIIFIIEIIRYAEKYKRSLSDFLISIKSRDFVSTSAIGDKTTKDILREAYNVILDEFRNIRIDKEIQYHYLNTMVEHIKTALLSFDHEGKIQFINKTASELLGVMTNQNISKIESIDSKLYQLIKRIKSGDNELIKLKINDELLHLSIYATELKVQKETIKLISLQNIKHELEYHELESWQKLIRVLTHEIMNSVTPISSLSSALKETMDETAGDKSNLLKMTNEDFDDMISSLQTIENRSKGLLKFVSSYKRLTRIPKPDFAEINLVELVNHSMNLLKQKISEYHIKVNQDFDDDYIPCFADYDQIEQVVINLLINAIDVVKELDNPMISVEIRKNKSNKPSLTIIDNGKGIDPEEIEKIFIPFYTTKKEGSGIGLSLSRQIMQLHKGLILVHSEIGKGTGFTLRF